MFIFISECVKRKLFLFLYISSQLFPLASTKWVEGHLKTSQKWAFLARFCFLSRDGQFEYQIEFDRDLGIPNLLLYYDDESQWPSVYHSNKSCHERENVLNKAGQNQVIPLTPWYPENDFSGCVMKQIDLDHPHSTTQRPSKHKPTLKINKDIMLNKTKTNSNVSTQDPRYYDQFLINTPTDNNAFVEVTTEPYVNTTENSNSTVSVNEEEYEVLEGYIAKSPERSEENVNDTDILANLNDVELLFNSSNKKQSNIIKRSVPRQNDRGKVKKFNPEPPRPLNVNLNSNRRIKVNVVCHNVRRFRSVRERWWFIAISNCDEEKGIDVKYKFLMTNGPPGDYWHEHFSADEFYVLPILMAFCFGYVFMILAIVMCSVELKTRQMLHTTYKLFVFSVSFQQAGILLQSLAYVKYASNGIGANTTKTFGQLFTGVSEISYLLLLVLMAKGYTITRARLKVAFTVKLTVFICFYSITFLGLFIYQAKEFDPGEVLYLYESPAGYGLIVLRICAWFMFVYAIIFTMRKYPEKGVFYFPFSLCGTMWFYAGPLFILTANNYIDKWVRESVVIAVLLFITFCGHVTFLLLTLPVFANKNFPYHVRTTQIGVMEVTGIVAGNSTIDHFSHNIYTPNSSNAGMAQSVIIPLTRRTEELIGGIHHYMATAPPLHALSPYHRGILGQMESSISHISGNIPDSFTINNIGPKLSVSTQHSTESTTSDKQSNHNGESRLDSMENRFVPQKANDTKQQSTDVLLDTLSNGKASQNGETDITLNSEDANTNEYSYKNDPNYIKDINNPFLVGASFKARRGLLEPIKRDPYNAPPPPWTLAKTRNTEKIKKTNTNNGVKKQNIDYHLQGVIGTFPLPQIQKKEIKAKKDDEEILAKEMESMIFEKDSSNDDSLQIMQQPEDKLDETTLALFSAPKNQ